MSHERHRRRWRHRKRIFVDVEVFSGVLLHVRLLSPWNSEWFIKERLRERKGGTERAARRGLINRRKERRQASLYYSLLQGNRERDKRVWRAELEIKEKTWVEKRQRWEDIFIWHSLSLLPYFASLTHACWVYVCHTGMICLISLHTVSIIGRLLGEWKKHGRVHMSIVIIIYSDVIHLVAAYKWVIYTHTIVRIIVLINNKLCCENNKQRGDVFYKFESHNLNVSTSC